MFDKAHDEYMHECVTVVMLVYIKQEKTCGEEYGVFEHEVSSKVKLVMWGVCRQM